MTALGSARPETVRPRSARFELRLSEDERAELMAEALKTGVSASALVRRRALAHRVTTRTGEATS